MVSNRNIIGRPRKEDYEKKTFSLPKVRLTEEEYEIFTNLVYRSRLTKSDFIKLSVFNKKIIIKQEQSLGFESLNELKCLGNNLNQIARKFNATDNINIPALNDLLELINDTIMKSLPDIEE